MLSVRRLRELSSSLRFRLVLWITLVVFVMVLVTNFAIHSVERLTLRNEYDKFLVERMEDIKNLVNLYDGRINDAPTLTEKTGFREKFVVRLSTKSREYEHRAWFLQLYDAQSQVIWSSTNAPPMDSPAFDGPINGPYDDKDHRVLEKRLRKITGEEFYIRCGYLQLSLQEDIDLLNRIILLASLSILLFAPLGGYFIALRATQPISQIITTTAHLQPDNMNERLPIRGTGDEIDQLSGTINGMLDRLASYIDHNRDFVANAAHELRSPLAAIRSSVEVGLNRSRTPEEYAVILTDVMEEISRLVGLVNRLLILAEGDAGRPAGKEQYTRLDKIVRESVEMFEAVAESRGVRLSLDEMKASVVRGDETYVRQVVRNLIDNAIKYNKNPGEVHIWLTVDLSAKQAVLIVKDTGIGIDREVLPRVFDRFYRADKSRSREKERQGYGLGLSICQTVVQALRGKIQVESELGRGSTFTVRLPLVDDPTALSNPGREYHLQSAGT